MCILRVHYIEKIDSTDFYGNKQNVGYIEVYIVNVILTFNSPHFEIKPISVINIILYTKVLSQFRAVHSYGTRNTRTGKQNYLKLLYVNFILVGLFHIHL